MISDREILESINKGSYWLKLTKLRALDYITGQVPKNLRLTKDGQDHLDHLIIGEKKLLLIWNDKTISRYFVINKGEFGKERVEFLRKLYTDTIVFDKKALQKFDEEHPFFDRLWCVRSGIATNHEWVPNSVPLEWARCLVQYEVTRPSPKFRYEVVVFSITG